MSGGTPTAPSAVTMLYRLALAFSRGRASVIVYDDEGSGESTNEMDALVRRLVVEELVGYPAEDVKGALLEEVGDA